MPERATPYQERDEFEIIACQHNLFRQPSGEGSLIKSGSRTLTLTGSNSYSGGTTLNAGTVALSDSYALGTGTVTFASNNTTLKAHANLNVANNIALTTNGIIDSGAFTLNNSGVISGAGALTKAGAGTTVLTSSNSYTGTTTISRGAQPDQLRHPLSGTTNIAINGGTLLLGASDQVNSGVALSMSAGSTLSMGGNGSTRASSQTFGTLTLTGNSTINFANLTGRSMLTFTGAGSLDGYSLSIWNWNSDDTHLVFSQGSSALSPADLANINFFSDNGTTSLGYGGFSGTEIVPVPEPSVIVAASLLVGFLLWSNRFSLRPRALVARRAYHFHD
jgi:autotransporter-associated beta strand protein